MKLFDFIKIFFSNKSNYDSLTNYQKSKQRFMINRFMSIKYPESAQALNVLGTKGEYVIDSWRSLSKQFTKTPGWIYTKVRKTKPKSTSKQFIPKEETIAHYIKVNELSMREYSEAMKFNEQGLLVELKNLEKIMTANDGE